MVCRKNTNNYVVSLLVQIKSYGKIMFGKVGANIKEDCNVDIKRSCNKKNSSKSEKMIKIIGIKNDVEQAKSRITALNDVYVKAQSSSTNHLVQNKRGNSRTNSGKTSCNSNIRYDSNKNRINGKLKTINKNNDQKYDSIFEKADFENKIKIEVQDLKAKIAKLRRDDLKFRSGCHWEKVRLLDNIKNLRSELNSTRISLKSANIENEKKLKLFEQFEQEMMKKFYR